MLRRYSYACFSGPGLEKDWRNAVEMGGKCTRIIGFICVGFLRLIAFFNYYFFFVLEMGGGGVIYFGI